MQTVGISNHQIHEKVAAAGKCQLVNSTQIQMTEGVYRSACGLAHVREALNGGKEQALEKFAGNGRNNIRT